MTVRLLILARRPIDLNSLPLGRLGADLTDSLIIRRPGAIAFSHVRCTPICHTDVTLRMKLGVIARDGANAYVTVFKCDSA